ncbi:hypothetical protein BH11BAC7_BH11BAC7_00990 [soil metagenome]
MKQRLILFPIIGILLFSCNNPPSDSKTTDTTIVSTTTQCYRYINNKDTVILKILETNGAIGGTLMYNFFEKDKNTGTFKGEMKGNLLIAQYTFMSEGMESVRAVAFKKSGENFIEGYGESEEKNGKDVFKNTDSLNFSNSILLSPHACEK